MRHINPRKRVSGSENVNLYSTDISEIENRRKAEKSDPADRCMEVRRLGSYPTSGKLRASAFCIACTRHLFTVSFTYFLSSYIISNFLQLIQNNPLRSLPQLVSSCSNVIMGSTSPTRGPASALFTPLSIANGTITLKHRIIMSPMTRNRCVPLSQTNTHESPNRVWIPDELVAKYYGQRATEGGLIVTESILPNAEAGAMPGVPGLWLPEHLAGWKLVRPLVFP
jgi:NADH:flavin oxidoreductase / NADH oxidase family